MNGEEYIAAHRLAKKEVQARISKGLDPEVAVLDEILEEKNEDIISEVPLGLVEVPLDQVVGTKTRGRKGAFAANFMPLLDEHTEFASKWMSLCQSHLIEGIRDPIKVYEYLNKFYVLEGNKRVSVLKYFGATSIPAHVTRLLPARKNTLESRIYYEFIDFYNVSRINSIWFTKEGSFPQLPALLGKRKFDLWTTDEKLLFRSTYNRFKEEYKKLGGDELSITPGDAFLVYLEVFGFDHAKDLTPTEISDELKKMWDDILLMDNDQEVDLKLHPSKEEKPNLFSKALSTFQDKDKAIPSKVAFIHAKSAQTSSWTYAHELGRMALDEKYGDKLQTIKYENITAETINDTIEQAIADGAKVIFTTTPTFYNASVLAAVNHPEVKILNCSLNASHKYVRTYYGRMYEAKFLSGVLAGILTDTNVIGYIADYPINGMVSNINAFAAGVKMVNPRARVKLEWSRLNTDQDPHDKLLEMGANIISNQDMITPKNPSRKIGLYRIEDGVPVNLGITAWQWDKYYELIIRSIEKGTWTNDEKTDSTKSLSYWWGFSAGVFETILSPQLPDDVRKLVSMLKKSISRYDFYPFGGRMKKQDGSLVPINEKGLIPPVDIITMDWLLENVDGYIPALEEFAPDAQEVIRMVGVRSVMEEEEA